MGHLRYSGPPYRGKPGKLAKHLGLSSGAMTNRLDNMERRGLVRRLDDPDDRRGVIVELTAAGQELWEETVGMQAQKEAFVAGVLDDDEKSRLNDLLRRMVRAFEDLHGPVHKHHA
jgi:DNA-binding MarR family transcriptional regulator